MTSAAVNLAELQMDLSRRFRVPFGIAVPRVPETIATGLSSINIPRGELTEIWGPDSSGKTSILVAALAHATRRPEFCALVDAGDGFDPASAHDAGVYLPHLRWVRCGGEAEKALKTADLLAHAGGFGIVAIDLAGVPAQQVRRISLASWFRLRQAVTNTPTALVVIARHRNAHPCSTLQIEQQPVRINTRGKLLRGIETAATLGPRQQASTALAFTPLYRP